MEKMDKSKSVGETININGISSISTKVNSKEEISHGIDANLYNINTLIPNSIKDIMFMILKLKFWSSSAPIYDAIMAPNWLAIETKEYFLLMLLLSSITCSV